MTSMSIRRSPSVRVRRTTAESFERLTDVGVAESEDGGGVEGGVLGPVDGHAGDGHAGGHLGDGEERVETGHARLADGDADDGEGGPGGDDAGEVGGHARGGDDHLEALVGGGGGEPLHLLRGAMGGHDVQLVLNAELAEGLEAGLENGDVGLGAREDGYARHGLIVGWGGRRVKEMTSYSTRACWAGAAMSRR
jgi:hypothetical protein